MNNLKSCNDPGVAATIRLVNIIREKENLPEQFRVKMDKQILKLSRKMIKQDLPNNIEIEEFRKASGREPIDAATFTLVNILREKDSLPARLQSKFDKRINKISSRMMNESNLFLHSLDIEKNDEDSVRAVIKIFPESLSHINTMGRIPIQEACYSIQSVMFVPLFAEEGLKMNVGGDSSRGGLLMKIPSEARPTNTLQLLSGYKHERNPNTYDKMSARVLKKLKRRFLMNATDIFKYDLAILASYPSCKNRFEQLINMKPNLLNGPENGEPFLNTIVFQENLSGLMERFELVLRAAIRYHPEKEGFLFRRFNENSENACDLAFKLLMKEEALTFIRKCVPECTNYQIYTRIYMQYFQ
jgi:hypothetical protein